MPANKREDIASDLRTRIEDALDKKGSRSKKNMEAVLVELGSPTTVANTYKGGSQYLIGPSFYPLYIRVLKLTFSIGMPIAFFIALITQIIQSPENISGYISAIISILIMVAFHMLFWVSLIFIIFERTNVKADDLTDEDTWSPDMLARIQTDRQIPTSEAISDGIWYISLTILPFVSQYLIGAHINGQTTPFFSQNIGFVWIAVIVAFGLVGIVKSMLKLRIKNWTPALTAFNVVYAVAFSVALAALVFMTQLVNPAFIALLDSHITTSGLPQVTHWVNLTVLISLAATISIYLYDAFNSVRLCRKRVK